MSDQRDGSNDSGACHHAHGRSEAEVREEVAREIEAFAEGYDIAAKNLSKRYSMEETTLRSFQQGHLSGFNLAAEIARRK